VIGLKDAQTRSAWLQQALAHLTPRELIVIQQRKLQEEDEKANKKSTRKKHQKAFCDKYNNGNPLPEDTDKTKEWFGE
jgi:hypothetical protein